MSKLRSIFRTEVELSEQQSMKEMYKGFNTRLEGHLKHSANLKKNQIMKQSVQMMGQLNLIKERSGKYKKRLFEQQKEFKEKIQNIIQYDIDRWQDYRQFFSGHFEELERNIDLIKGRNKEYKQQIQLKIEQLKQIRRKNHIYELLTDKMQSSDRNTTKESSIKLSYSETGNKRLKTDNSLPLLKPSTRYLRLKTVETEYDQSPKPEQKGKQRAMSYMGAIGSVKKKQVSILPFLEQLLGWYKQKENPNSNWFLKVIYNPRNYNKLKEYIRLNSGVRTVIQKK